MLFLRKKSSLFLLGLFIIVCSCNPPSKINKPESQINRQADSLLLICINVLDTVEHKYESGLNLPVFAKNYIEHELDTTVTLKAYCIDQYLEDIEYDSLMLAGMFNRIQFDEYNEDSTPRKIDTSLIRYFNYVSIDSVRKYRHIINSNYKYKVGYHVSKPILSNNRKYIYFEWTVWDGGWYCILEKGINGSWFLKKIGMRYIV
ncbi:MAG: hypothetical protein IT271_05910 [Chitinophagales bacterium]|nr:hypothetical protein [Chitinophagales bacterium]